MFSCFLLYVPAPYVPDGKYDTRQLYMSEQPLTFSHVHSAGR
ncbi:hypothetical protein HMPREF1548_01623 [Clostridium sp. KLE 1755]|nr:hypothetical protein HMPREF1548_01623 [Clostridium sp. KLE 1755]